MIWNTSNLHRQKKYFSPNELDSARRPIGQKDTEVPVAVERLTFGSGLTHAGVTICHLV